MKHQHGLTLIELLLSVAVFAVIVALGIPSYSTLTQSNRASTDVNTVVGLAQVARSTAITQRRDVTVCPSSDAKTCDGSTDWSRSLIVRYTPPDKPPVIVRVTGALEDGIDMRFDEDSLVFGRRGGTDVSATTHMVYCDGRGHKKAKLIEITRTGQVSVLSKNNPDVKKVVASNMTPDDEVACP